MQMARASRFARKLGVVFAWLAVLAAACGPASAPSQGSGYTGTIGPGCAPLDGPAIELALAPTGNGAAEKVFISLWRDLPPRPGRFYAIGPLGEAGAASLCSPGGECQAVASGTVALTRYEDGVGAAGRLSFELESGRKLQGEFSVAWSAPYPAFCG